MTIRHANAEWQGTLKEGSGRLSLGSGVFEAPIRSRRGSKTDPAPIRRN